MLIHDFDIFRWILDDDAATVYATGSVLTDPAVGSVGDVDCTAVDDPHEEGPARRDQHDAPRGVRLRPALRGDRRERDAAGGQPQADRGRLVDRRSR
jgi:myo-inositol 2-dehydrogenase/D-chiro-inositol 1-dehydrogenase